MFNFLLLCAVFVTVSAQLEMTIGKGYGFVDLVEQDDQFCMSTNLGESECGVAEDSAKIVTDSLMTRGIVVRICSEEDSFERTSFENDYARY